MATFLGEWGKYRGEWMGNSTVPEAACSFQVHGIGRFATVSGFLRVLGAVYLSAFVSFGVQAQGLIGSRGILPAGEYLAGLAAGFGKGRLLGCAGSVLAGSGRRVRSCNLVVRRGGSPDRHGGVVAAARFGGLPGSVAIALFRGTGFSAFSMGSASCGSRVSGNLRR